MDVYNENKLDKQKDCLERILSQHIYKQNDHLKKVWTLSGELVELVSNSQNLYLSLLSERKVDLYQHLICTTVAMVELGSYLAMNLQQLQDMAFGSMIHDIGLGYISMPYQNRDMERLNPAQLFEFKRHTVLGYTSIEDQEWMPEISKKMVLSHHETLDGKGYPLKQKNEEIECRMIQICDAFDSVLSGIECSRGTLEEAIQKIKAGAGVLFDSNLTEVFLKKII